MIGDQWGVSRSEISRSYPCDDFVDSPTLRAWRGVTVEAPADAVWPWVAQVRIAPYSYDWIDNRGHRSPRRLTGLPEAHPGDRFTTAAGRPLGRIVSVDPGRQLTGRIGGVFMSYVLVPQGPDATRLLLKIVARSGRWTAMGLSVGDLVMARRQLLNFKRLAEHRQHGSPTARFNRSTALSAARPIRRLLATFQSSAPPSPVPVAGQTRRWPEGQGRADWCRGRSEALGEAAISGRPNGPEHVRFWGETGTGRPTPG